MSAPSFDLSGRTALVTGASRGLGRAMAIALAHAGAQLVLWGRKARELASTARDVERAGSSAAIQRVDVTDRAAIRRAVRAAGRIDVLINNAGIWDGDTVVKISERAWNRVLATDLSSVLFVTQAVAPGMMRRGYGKIIHISSTAGLLAYPDNAAYGSAKAALMHLTRVMAVELGPRGVRVNSIAPGVFRTDMTEDMFEDRAWVKHRLSRIPLRRFGQPHELGGLAIFLASPASDHVTGQTIVIDGGASLTP